MRLFFGLSFLSLSMLACGSSKTSTPPPSAGPYASIDAGDPEAGTDRYLPDLTLAERKTLCDWVAGTEGGYGKLTTCDGSYVVNFKNQDACLAQYLGGCTSVTVLDYETCIKVIGANMCADSLYTAPECLGVEKCIGMTDGGPPPDPAADGG